MTTINVDIVTQYKGSQQLKKAKSDIESLASSFKRLVGGFALEEIVRRSVTAFSTENAAVSLLSNSLKNLGVNYADIQPSIDATTNSFVDLGFKTADTLQAITSLTTALGNPAKALQVLGTAADLARFNHASLGDTAIQVSKAIAGNSRAFAALGLKIDKTLTPQNAFNKLMDEAKAKVGGAAKAYSQTAAGAIDVFNAKMDSATVKLGKGLMPAIQMLAEFALKYIVPVINFLAKNITPILTMAAALYSVSLALKAIGIASEIMAGEIVLNPIFAVVAALTTLLILYNKMKDVTTSNKMGTGGSVSGTATTAPTFDPLHQYLDPKKQAAYDAKVKLDAHKKVVDTQLTDAQKLAKSEADLQNMLKKWSAGNLTDAKALTAQAQAKLKAERDTLNLKLAGSTADMQNIEIQAALQKGQTQQVTDVLLLQRAILNQNADQAEVLSQEILKANGLVMDVSGNISAIGQATNPFADWPTQAQTALDQIKLMLASLVINPSKLFSDTVSNPLASLGTNGINASVTAATLNQIANGGDVGFASAANAAQGNNVNITVTTSPDLTVTATQTASSNGSSVTLSRLNPFGQYGLGF
jgi:hypothetical protein